MMVASVAGCHPAVFANTVKKFVKSGFTLLLAEDDEADVMLFTRLLEESSQKAAVRVRLAVTRNGEDALAYLKGEGEFSDRTKHPFPDLVVTDLKMPRLNGLGVLAWMKEHLKYQGVPSIMLSGSAEECDVAEAHRLGVNTFFQKPTTLYEFRELVDQIVCYWSHNQRPVMRQLARGIKAGVPGI